MDGFLGGRGMKMLLQIGVNALYLLAMINPVSKVAVLSALSGGQGRRRDFRSLAGRSSLAAAGILFGAMVAGDFVLRSMFRVEFHSLRIAGGAVLFWVGFNGLRRGVFFEQGTPASFEEMALVPLACPMIAGPATIAACIDLRAHEGLLITTAAMLIALGANHCIMLMSSPIERGLARYNILGALIRLTGLVVMTIGIELVLDGITTWMTLAGR